MSNPINLDLNNTSEVVCESCGNDTFMPVFFIRKVSRFISHEDSDKIIPIDSLACVKCKHINADFKLINNQ